MIPEMDVVNNGVERSNKLKNRRCSFTVSFPQVGFFTLRTNVNRLLVFFSSGSMSYPQIQLSVQPSTSGNPRPNKAYRIVMNVDATISQVSQDSVKSIASSVPVVTGSVISAARNLVEAKDLSHGLTKILSP